ncbi:MAG: hypothetical protein WBL27_04445 [Salinimicrobium sp.]
MKNEQEYIKDISEIRSMMERSTRFLSLTGWAGIMAGIYALAGTYIAYLLYYSQPEGFLYSSFERQEVTANMLSLVSLGTLILVLAVGTAVYLSYRKARKNGQPLWNPVARRLVSSMAIPLVAGGILILLLMFQGFIGLAAPLSLIFYGLALVNAGRFTFDELRSLGITQVVLGLLSSWFIGYALLLWGLGFGLMHIAYGIYMQQKYDK